MEVLINQLHQLGNEIDLTRDLIQTEHDAVLYSNMGDEFIDLGTKFKDVSKEYRKKLKG